MKTPNQQDKPRQIDEQADTPKELATLKKVHPQTVIRWFEAEPGVLRISRDPLSGKDDT